ncbi:MAG TPA: hypothetical protein VF203_07165 [Burkholderiales bacterium]
MREQGTLKLAGAGFTLAPPPGAAIALPARLAGSAAVAAFALLYTIQTAGSFLWFLEAALGAAFLALWLESRLLASIAALAALLPQLAWDIGFTARLLGSADPLGLAAPAFIPGASWSARAVAFVHFGFPVVLLWMLVRLGYDARALRVQTLLTWLTLALSYGLAETAASRIPGSLGVGDNLARAWLPGPFWLLVAMLAYPLLVYVPTHFVLRALCGRSAAGVRRGAADAARGGPGHARRRAAAVLRFVLLRRRR